MKPRYPRITFDKLQIYRGRSYTIDLEGVRGQVIVKSPYMGDIIDIGESRFYSNLAIIVGNTTQYRLTLWRGGVDWNTISDFEMFTKFYWQLDKDVVNLLFDNIDDFSEFDVYERQREDGTTETLLYNERTDIEITEEVYQYFHQYFQNVFKMKPEEEITKDKHLKEWWIRKDTVEEEQKKRKGEESEFSFVPMISAYVNNSDTKHSLDELDSVGVAEFFDSISRIVNNAKARAMLGGLYSGFVNGDKINPSEYDLMKEL